jgi:hypothetical protein
MMMLHHSVCLQYQEWPPLRTVPTTIHSVGFYPECRKIWRTDWPFTFVRSGEVEHMDEAEWRRPLVHCSIWSPIESAATQHIMLPHAIMRNGLSFKWRRAWRDLNSHARESSSPYPVCDDGKGTCCAKIPKSMQWVLQKVNLINHPFPLGKNDSGINHVVSQRYISWDKSKKKKRQHLPIP